MPRKDGTGPDGNGPKQVNQGTPTPKRNGFDQQNNSNKGQGQGQGQGQGRGLGKNKGRYGQQR